MTPQDFPTGTSVQTNFLTETRSIQKVGLVTKQASSTLNSKLRGCVMVLWDGTSVATPVHPTNLTHV